MCVVVVVCTGHMGWRRFARVGLYPLPEEELGRLRNVKALPVAPENGTQGLVPQQSCVFVGFPTGCDPSSRNRPWLPTGRGT